LATNASFLLISDQCLANSGLNYLATLL